MSSEAKPKGSFWSWIVMGGSAVGIFVLGMLASSITERRSESIQARVQFMKPGACALEPE